MTVLDQPRHPIVTAALRLASAWCAGHVIDDAPALRHAVLVARILVRHVPTATPELVAAALLHDAEEFVPDTIDLDATLAAHVGPGVAPLVHALAAHHRAMDTGGAAVRGESAVTLIAGADKIVAFRSLLRRARLSGDPARFWNRRAPLRALLPYFQDWCHLHAPQMPRAMATELHAALFDLIHAITTTAPISDRPAEPGRLTTAVRDAQRAGTDASPRPAHGGSW